MAQKDMKNVIFVASKSQMDVLDFWAEGKDTTREEFLRGVFSPYDIHLTFQSYNPAFPDSIHVEDYQSDTPEEAIMRAKEGNPECLIVDPLGYVMNSYEDGKIVTPSDYRTLLSLLEAEQKNAGIVMTIAGANTNRLSPDAKKLAEKRDFTFVTWDTNPDLADLVSATVHKVYGGQ